MVGLAIWAFATGNAPLGWKFAAAAAVLFVGVGICAFLIEKAGRGVQNIEHKIAAEGIGTDMMTDRLEAIGRNIKKMKLIVFLPPPFAYIGYNKVKIKINKQVNKLEEEIGKHYGSKVDLASWNW